MKNLKERMKELEFCLEKNNERLQGCTDREKRLILLGIRLTLLDSLIGITEGKEKEEYMKLLESTNQMFSK